MTLICVCISGDVNLNNFFPIGGQSLCPEWSDCPLPLDLLMRSSVRNYVVFMNRSSDPQIAIGWLTCRIV